VEGSGRVLFLKYYFLYENLSQASRSPGRDLNPRPLEYENYELKRSRRVPIEGINLALARRDEI
jgi:hypothetical protein